MQVRRLSSVPKITLVLLAGGFAAQLAWHFVVPAERPNADNLPKPPSLESLQLTSLGEPIAYAKLLLLYLQTFDNQPGVSVPFRKLDYPRLQAWLGLTLHLDPLAEYPLFLASHVYGSIGDPTKQRLMFNFVYQEFLLDPNRRWRELAHAAIMTRHQLNDLQLAQQYTEALRLHATGPDVPGWVRQMDIFMLEDMDQFDRALMLLDTLLQSGQVTDAHELQFLQDRRNKILLKSQALQLK